MLSINLTGTYRCCLALPPGSYKAEWIDPATGNGVASTDFQQTAATHLLETPTYAIDIALSLKKQ